MTCNRCKKAGPTRKLSVVLRYALLPLWPFLYLQSEYRGAFIEGAALYCKDCSRILNMCLFFVVFFFILLPVLVMVST